MASLLDSPRFNESLFFPQWEDSPPPPGAEDRIIEVSQGRLRVRLHPKGTARSTLLLFGGNGESASNYDVTGAHFAAFGVRLAIADYRGYGMSEGTPTLRRALEDADVCYDYLRGELSGPLGVMGRSLGSQCAAQLAPRSDLAYLVWESGFLDLKALVARRGMPVPAAFSEDDLAVFDPAPKLNAGRAPLLVVHADEDQVIHPSEAQRAFEGYPCSRKTMALIPHRGHNDISTSPRYWQAMTRFFLTSC